MDPDPYWIRIGSGSVLDPDPYWIRIRIGIQPKMLDPDLDPDPDAMNADPQPWFIVILVFFGMQECVGTLFSECPLFC